MTRRLEIVNLSNHPNEDYIVSGGGLHQTVTIKPGETAMIHLYSGDTDINIAVAGDDSGEYLGWDMAIAQSK